MLRTTGGEAGGFSRSRSICADPFSATLSIDAKNNPAAPQDAFFQAGGIFLVRCGLKTKTKHKPKTKPWGEADTASRRSAPSPGKRNASGGPRSISSSTDEF